MIFNSNASLGARFVNRLKKTLFRELPPPNVGHDNKSNRDAWLARTLKRIPDGSRILDAGAGELRYRTLCAHLDYVSQDFGQYHGGDGPGLQHNQWDNSQLDLVCDITAIPEPDASFDAIMCVEVLEHVPEPVDALKELHRLLKPGGHLILTAPFCSLTHFAPYHFATGLSRYWYEHWLEQLGYDILDLTLNGNYFSYMAQEAGRVQSLVERYASIVEWTSQDSQTIHRFLNLLDRLNKVDSGSNELLCYGIQVFAKKRER